mgnify:CR=1 FL=1
MGKQVPLMGLNREFGPTPKRSRHCKEEQSCTEQSDTVTEEDALGRRSRARIPSQENCLFCAT